MSFGPREEEGPSDPFPADRLRAVSGILCGDPREEEEATAGPSRPGGGGALRGIRALQGGGGRASNGARRSQGGGGDHRCSERPEGGGGAGRTE